MHCDHALSLHSSVWFVSNVRPVPPKEDVFLFATDSTIEPGAFLQKFNFYKTLAAVKNQQNKITKNILLNQLMTSMQLQIQLNIKLLIALDI